jgi:hypothetical protein
MMSRIRGLEGKTVLAACLLALTRAGLVAQELGVNTSVEAAGDGLYVLFSEMGLARVGAGLRPVATLSAHLVLSDEASSWGAAPAAGLRYRGEIGFVQAEVGWAFRDERSVAYFGGRENGLHTSLQGEFRGDAYSATGVVTYNWGADYLWTHARVGRRLGELAEGGAWGLGAELVYQSEVVDPSPLVDGVRATQIGPVVQWIPGAARPTFWFSAGWKRSELGPPGENTWYVRGEVGLP